MIRPATATIDRVLLAQNVTAAFTQRPLNLGLSVGDDEAAVHRNRDVVLQARSGESVANRTIRLRCVTEPDGAQKALLSRLGLTLPRRLRRIDEAVPRGHIDTGLIGSPLAQAGLEM